MLKDKRKDVFQSFPFHLNSIFVGDLASKHTANNQKETEI